MKTHEHSNAGDLLIWQIADTAFPVGGFAHSGGLESARQSGDVTSPEDLRDFVDAAIVQAKYGMLPFVKAAHEDAGSVYELDSLCDAFLVNHVANRASRALGSALLYVAGTSFHIPAFASLADEWRRRGTPQHYGVAFGVTGRLLSISLPKTLELALFILARDLISSAVRLNIIGPLRAQTLLFELGPSIIRASNPDRVPSPAHAAQTAPVMDVLQNAHDGLYTRLFQS
ncbi:MAG: urease accessory UreF family protein [Polyangiales bacterium]